jgi:hypothetical protein
MFAILQASPTCSSRWCQLEAENFASPPSAEHRSAAGSTSSPTTWQ